MLTYPTVGKGFIQTFRIAFLLAPEDCAGDRLLLHLVTQFNVQQRCHGPRDRRAPRSTYGTPSRRRGGSCVTSHRHPNALKINDSPGRNGVAADACPFPPALASWKRNVQNFGEPFVAPRPEGGRLELRAKASPRSGFVSRVLLEHSSAFRSTLPLTARGLLTAELSNCHRGPTTPQSLKYGL